MIPLTPNHDSQSHTPLTNNSEEIINDEITNLHQRYKILAYKNRE